MPKKSNVWQHFTRVMEEHGKFVNEGECNHCSKVLKTKDGTSNMWKHLRKFHPQEAAAVIAVGSVATPPPQQKQPPLHPLCTSSTGSTGSMGEEANKHLARMIALHGYDPSVLEDACFRSFVAILSPEFRVPSRVHIEEMCDGILDDARRDLFDKLTRIPRVMLSLAVGKAKTLEVGEVVYLACHFIDDQWKAHKLVLGSHVAAQRQDLDDVIDTVVTDAVFVSDYGIKYRQSIVAYEITDDSFHPRLKDYLQKEASLVSQEICCTTSVDSVLHAIALCFLPSVEFTVELDFRIDKLQLNRQKRQQILSILGLHNPWTYAEKWYACYCSLKILCHERDPLSLGIETDLITASLCTIWGEIYGAIQRISDTRHPTSNLCLQELLNVRKALLSELDKVTGDHAICYEEESTWMFQKDIAVVLEEAKDCLDKAIQDSYLIWSIPLALDPRYKLSLYLHNFSDAFGPEVAANYFSQVTRKFEKLYTDYAEDGRGSAMTIVSSDPLQQPASDEYRSAGAQTELSRYLNDPLVEATEGFDILNWWKDSSQSYPTVARMARDALALPASSKLSSDQIAHVRSMVRGYSNAAFGDVPF